MPVTKQAPTGGKYDIYPSFKIADGKIFTGFESLAERIKGQSLVMIDGYSGAFFTDFKDHLASNLCNSDKINWINTEDLLKSPVTIDELTSPFLGGDDPLFGKRTTLNLQDFFDPEKLADLKADPPSGISIIAGPGAALANRDGLLVYLDIPKNEIQYRARAGSVTNLGYTVTTDPKEMYKRFYFVDWVVLNKHKQSILRKINIFVDGQHPDDPVWIEGDDLRAALLQMSRNLFRTRPWFEPGSWGGTWIRDNIDGLNKNVPNYAWSFELISPENGLLIESSSLLCEVSFDCLMYLEASAVLGDCYSRFVTDFPIRFDFLDTFDGGNLSLQCHPRPGYMKENFGEDYTQEETYYILDTKDDAAVYLGFRENVNPQEFKSGLEDNLYFKEPFNPEKYVLQHPVKKHDLLLIPYGTIHSSGKNNLVLEISTTPYIFTFKMYDWERPDLDGKPRPVNIKRAFENLYFERSGNYVYENLISRPELAESGPDWKLFHLPTHETHLYDVYRYHFHKMIEIRTNNKCLVMNLTEGTIIEVITENGLKSEFSFAETFVIPAAANSVRIYNPSAEEAVLVKAFVK